MDQLGHKDSSAVRGTGQQASAVSHHAFSLAVQVKACSTPAVSHLTGLVRFAKT